MDVNVKKAFKEIAGAVRENPAIAGYDERELRAFIEEKERLYSEKNGFMPIKNRAEVISGVYSSIRGYGILDRILADDAVTEIMINGPDEVFVEKKGKVIRTDYAFESEEKLEDIIQRIVGSAGREVNFANPVVDTRLPDGSRVNVVLPPVSLCGAAMTIRKFSKEPIDVGRLIGFGSLTSEAAEALGKLVKAKYNIFISGGTGSGKTTFLNALAGFIPDDERVITIEDSAELRIRNLKNLISLETRNANSAGTGEITVRDLIKASLRMRPERIIVGEVRGGEALDMLQAMNTGHDGSISTGHANSTQDILSRLETMVLMGASGLPLRAIRNQIVSAIDVIIHLSRFRDGSRKTVEISEITGIRDGEITLNPLFVYEYSGAQTSQSGRLVRTGNRLVSKDKLIAAGLGTDL